MYIHTQNEILLLKQENERDKQSVVELRSRLISESKNFRNDMVSLEGDTKVANEALRSALDSATEELREYNHVNICACVFFCFFLYVDVCLSM
jgi:hypothetical protein